jgi:predicted nucleotidyltransferase
MNKEILNKIKQLKNKYESEGFIILGVFGSYARNEENSESDLDILYELTDIFHNRFSGWNAFPEIEKINNDIEISLGVKIDLADRNALNRVGKKYILPEVQYF